MGGIRRRACLLLLMLYGAYTGFWAYVAPRSWYDGFPGFGRSWLPPLGPYNEHFASDIGAAYLAFAALSALALRRVRDHRLVAATGAAWLVFNVLHLVCHLRMLRVYGPLDRTLTVLALVVFAAASAVLALPRRRPV
ncbi:hypothetical protein [Streptomyces caatingaensis]|uniref:Uncharacterized protein n=1 Tax=Streptomyces caatingaensis TaxID=1678637 RepID=A0A0K9XKV3_9ACTN|nr:hypothetical protein [Streptomyces caatingaensis]KNB54019.1 hypothetical protein AC230_05585 [Streptomyces caatingaensis]